MKLLFVTNLPAPYRVRFFDELSKLCTLTVCYERRASAERDAAWKREKQGNYEEIFCEGKEFQTDASIGFDLVRKVKSLSFDHIIVSGYSSPSVMLLIRYLKRHKIPYCIESDGGFFKKDPPPLRWLKQYLLRQASVIFTTGEETVRYYRSLGCKNTIVKYPFSSIREEEIASAPASEAERTDLRRELGMTEKRVVISVGRFSYLGGYGKGYDVLLRCAKELEQEDIGWYIIGGKPTEEFENMQKDMGLDKVHFVDFTLPEKLRLYYRAADLSVLMTVGDVWGLVVNESMACGTPVITSDRCIAGLEMIEDGVHGYVVPVGDSAALGERITELFHTPGLPDRMRSACLERISHWTIERMAKVHGDVLRERSERV